MFFILSSFFIQAQIPADYSIGRWYKYKEAAVSYTFDEFYELSNTPGFKHISNGKNMHKNS
ncbi:MAG: hypothetical protein ACOCWB_02460 [Bacteroidota bacterium]